MTLRADRAALDARMVLKNPQRQGDSLRVLDVHDARAGIGPENPKTTGGAEIIAPIQAYSTPRWSANLSDGDKSLGLGNSRFRKTALLQELADDGNCVRGARYAGRKFLGRDQPRQRRGDHPHRRQYGHAGLENVDVGISRRLRTKPTHAKTRTRSGLTSNYGRGCRTSFSTAPNFPRGAKCRFRKPTARPSA